jgi:hypothetical protein
MTAAQMREVTAGRADQEDIALPPRTQTAVERAPAGQPPSQTYLFEPARVGQDRRRLQTEANRIQQLFRIAAASRDVAAATQLRQRSDEINEQLRLLNGLDTIIRFRGGDIAPLAAALYDESQGAIELEPQANGTFNVYQNGQLARQNVSRTELESSARLLFDSRYQALAQQRVQQANELAILRARENIEQEAIASREAVILRLRSQLERSAPDLDVRVVQNTMTGQSMVVVTDKRSGAPVRAFRIDEREPLPNTREPRIILQDVPINAPQGQ